MDLKYTDEQEMLAKTVADFAAKESPVERVRKMRDDETGWSKALWKQMGELGWLSIPFPESCGGFGGSFVDAALVLEKMGKTLVPEPYIPSVVLAGTAIAEAGTAEQLEKYLTPLISGDVSYAFAADEADNRYHWQNSASTAEKDGDQWKLSGNKHWVENGHAADYVFATATTDTGVGLFIVAAEHCKSQRLQGIDSRKYAHLSFDNAPAESLGTAGEPTAKLLDKLFDYGAAACCAEGLGVVQAAFDMTLDYLKTREQFGTKIGSFQALQHRAVDMYIENQLLKASALAGTIRCSEDDVNARSLAVSSAKCQFTGGGNFVVQQAIQLHGGIGVTDEHDIGLYFKRAQALNILFGDQAWHEKRYADLGVASE